jgi:ArsR family transcriptional regulator
MEYTFEQRLPVMCCGPFARPLAPAAADEIARRFKALSDPTRVAIVNRLAAADECCVCDLTEAFELSQPTISHHLRVLRDAGLVESSRRGTWAYYRLVPDAVQQLRQTLGG